MKKCSYAHQYKARKAPKCNHGAGCDSCKEKWQVEQRLQRIEYRLEQLERATGDSWI